MTDTLTTTQTTATPLWVSDFICQYQMTDTTSWIDLDHPILLGTSQSQYHKSTTTIRSDLSVRCNRNY